MRRRDLLGLIAAVPALAQPKMPRRAPEFTFSLVDGGSVSLAQFRGKVVLLEFMITTCPHCQEASRLATKLQSEYGARGFQALGVAFDEMARMNMPEFLRITGAKHPIGVAPREAVYKFLGEDMKYGIHVPQLAFVDRNGMIRAQSLPREDYTTALEENVRGNIEALLKEKGAAGAARR